jgi:hypothetical protein
MYVTPHNGRWAVKRPNAIKPSNVYDTQAEAIERAHEIADGGPVHIQGVNGKLRIERRKA